MESSRRLRAIVKSLGADRGRRPLASTNPSGLPGSRSAPGASSGRRPKLLVVLGALFAAAALFAVDSTPALAAAPEAPEAITPNTEVVTATEAPLAGFLYPGQEGATGLEPLTYEFLYKESASECAGAGSTATSEQTSLGEGRERVGARAEGLSPGATYTFCLRAKNAAAEASVSAPITFRTAIPPEVPTGEEAVNVTATSATLRGTLNPNNPGLEDRYKFRYAPSATECEGPGGKEIPETAVEVPSAQGEVVEQQITELLPLTTYTYCLFVRNAPEETVLGSPVTFTTPAGAPGITSEGVKEAFPTSAVLAAQINPGGLNTQYQLELVTNQQFEASEWAGALVIPTAPRSLPAGSFPLAVTLEAVSLTSATEYRFRFVAANGLGTARGLGGRFVTPSGVSEPALPDGRQYELVSAGSSGEVYGPDGLEIGVTIDVTETAFPFRASADGEALTYVGDPRDSGGNGLTGAATGNQFLATRGPTGWQVSTLTPQAAAPGEAEFGTEFQGFSEDLNVGILAAKGRTPFGSLTHPPAPPSCDALYRTEQTGVYGALFSETQTPSSCGEFTPNRSISATQRLLFAGGNAGSAGAPPFTSLLFQSGATLTPEASPIPETSGGGANLYLSAGGAIHLVSILPSGAPSPEATFGSLSLLTGAHTTATPYFNYRNIISPDGQRVIFTDQASGRIYLRTNPTAPQSEIGGTEDCLEPADACTVPVSQGRAVYWAASSDDSLIFYTENGELWQFDALTGTRQALIAEGLEGEPANVVGVVGAGEDGSSIYFVAESKLASGAEARQCEGPRSLHEEEEEAKGGLPPGRGCNLYLLQGARGTTFIATLAPGDGDLTQLFMSRTNSYGAWKPDSGDLTAEVTPDGRTLVFESLRDLVGYRPSSVQVGGNPYPLQAFVYRAPSAAQTGSLNCVSCDPLNRRFPSSGEEVPTQLPLSLNPTFMHRWISDDGDRVFFESRRQLVPADSNNARDVYEWEREGTSGCPKPTSDFGGCVFLLSGGASEYSSRLIDSSASGNDVFFVHRGQLGGVGGRSGQSAMFDARVGGGFSEPSGGCAALECAANSTGGSSVVEAQSATYSGPGNHHVRKRHKKKRRHHHKHRAKHQSSSHHHRRPNANPRYAK